MFSRTLIVATVLACACAAKLTALDAEVYPRDFKQIPVGTDYGEGEDGKLNREVEEVTRVKFLGESLGATLKMVSEVKKHPTFTTALIAGDMVILDQIVKMGLIDKIQVVFVDTFHLFPETPLFMAEVEKHYGFKAKWYHAKDTETEEEFKTKFGNDWWSNDIDAYDMKCKVEPLKRSLSENSNDMWINGRRRDMGALRANLPIWEGGKLNPLAFWTFEDCWNYLKINKVPYHPLHDHGYSSLGDVQSTLPVEKEKWFTYGGERSGRFQNLKNKDGSAKTECGIHTELPLGRKPPAQSKAEL